jgi:probable HAF family extracellular repeat protein
MKRISFWAAFCILALTASALYAAQNIDSVTATPSLVLVSQSTPVRIEATIAQDASLIRTSVTLVQLGPGDIPVGSVGQLVDDGTGGDIAPNDNVFTIVLPVVSATPTSLRYRVSVAYRGSLRRLQSAPFTILVNVAAFASAVDQTQVITDPAGTYPVNELLLTLNSGFTASDADAIISPFGGSIVGFDPSSNTFQIRLLSGSSSLLGQLITSIRSDPRVLVVMRNQALAGQVINDLTILRALNATLTAAYDKVQLFAAWNAISNMPFYPVTVGLVDTPVDRTHQEWVGVDFGNSPILPIQPSTACNEPAHGTEVAGIIGANNASALGPLSSTQQMAGILAGIPSAVSSSGSAIPYTLAVQSQGGGYMAEVLAATSLLISTNPSVKVINFSFGLARASAFVPAPPSGPCGSFGVADDEFASATTLYGQLINQHTGILFVVAAGNYGNYLVNVADVTPANVTAIAHNIMAVAATNPDDRRSLTSEFGGGITIAAPGSGVYKPSPGNTYNTADSGTSFAAPLVAGTAGLLLSIDPTMSPIRTKMLLQSTADVINTDEPIGGRLNILSAVQQIPVIVQPDFTMTSGGNSATNGQMLSITLPVSATNASVSVTSVSGGSLSLDGAPLFSIAPQGVFVFSVGVGSHTLSLMFRGFSVQGVITVGPATSTTGTIGVTATLDGQAWPSSGAGSISYTLTGPSNSISGTAVPATYSSLAAGTYTLRYISGGPPNARQVGLSPCSGPLLASCAAALGAGQTLAFTIQFISNPPTAGFTMSSGSQSANNGQTLTVTVSSSNTATVSFDARASSSGFNGNTITGWTWTANNSLIATTSTFSATFPLGNTTIGLVVQDSRGVQSQPVQGTVNISTGQPPTARYTFVGNCQFVTLPAVVDLVGPVSGTTATFDGSVAFSAVQGATITNWLWSVNGVTSATTPVFSQVFPPGTYTVSLVVTDSTGATSPSKSTQVVVSAAQGIRQYNILHLGSVGIETMATGVNNQGQVVGNVVFGSAQQGFRTSPNMPINPSTDMLGTLGGASSSATGVNSSGQVVGVSDPTGGQGTCAFRTGANSPINPQTDSLHIGCGGPFSNDFGAAINDAGQAGGFITTTSAGFFSGFRTLPNQLINVNSDLLGVGQSVTSVHGLNSLGQAVGTFGFGSCYTGFRTAPNSDINLATDNLGSLGMGCTYPTAINASGQVVGYSNASSSTVHSFRTLPNAAINPITDDLGAIAPYVNSFATSINTTGTAVGSISTSQFGYYSPAIPTIAGGPSVPARAVIWNVGSTIQDLNQLLDPNSGWLLVMANAINDQGQIVGLGCFDNEQRAYLLTPLP